MPAPRFPCVRLVLGGIESKPLGGGERQRGHLLSRADDAHRPSPPLTWRASPLTLSMMRRYLAERAAVLA